MVLYSALNHWGEESDGLPTGDWARHSRGEGIHGLPRSSRTRRWGGVTTIATVRIGHAVASRISGRRLGIRYGVTCRKEGKGHQDQREHHHEAARSTIRSVLSLRGLIGLGVAVSPCFSRPPQCLRIGQHEEQSESTHQQSRQNKRNCHTRFFLSEQFHPAAAGFRCLR